MEEGKYIYKYPHAAITTDSVVFGFDGKVRHVLLIERKGEPYKGVGHCPADSSAWMKPLRNAPSVNWRKRPM